MSGGLRAAKRASMPSGYGSRLISLTLIDGYARSKRWIVARMPLSSTGDELQCASVIVVVLLTALARSGLAVVAAVVPAATPTTSAAPASDAAARRHECGRRPIPPPFAFARDRPTTLNLRDSRRVSTGNVGVFERLQTPLGASVATADAGAARSGPR